MHIEQVISQLREMRFSTMAESLRERIKNGDHQGISPEQFVAILEAVS